MRFKYFLLFVVFSALSSFAKCAISKSLLKIENQKILIEFQESERVLFTYKVKNSSLAVPVYRPVFEIDGKETGDFSISKNTIIQSKNLYGSVTEYCFDTSLQSDSSIHLTCIFRMADDNSIVRFRYKLFSAENHKLTKINKADNLQYFSASLTQFKNFSELRFSDYNERYHCFILKEQEIKGKDLENNLSVMGPLFLATGTKGSSLIAYEHGSQFPDAFLRFLPSPTNNISVEAVKANYLHGQLISVKNPFESVWFEIAAVGGNKETLAQEYRTFILKYMTENTESRQPYIFFNTWGRQERDKWSGGEYLQNMRLDYTLKEIERAHQMGIEVYVMDVGWFKKSGDYQVNLEWFPDTLKQVKRLLDKYNMKLGLWFNPVAAGITSKMLAKNPNCTVTKDGNEIYPWVWGTEKSKAMCMVSDYWEAYANELIRLVKETGVRYFKWDAIGQYDCNDPRHHHGNEANTLQERAERHAYLLPIYLSKVVDKVCKAYPNLIFDFDITEGGRAVGLSFLSSGKYFAINNGPYFHSFNICNEWEGPFKNGNSNIFVNPGPARGWFVRAPLVYDKWFPTVLFLTHYQPDEPKSSQLLNVASLILGQNGIWGDILKTSEEGVKYIHDILEKYKQVREDITEASMMSTGEPGETFEIHEKINTQNGKGAVVLFSNSWFSNTYVTNEKVDKNFWCAGDCTVSFDSKGRAVIKTDSQASTAVIVFFGVKK
jgi:alpha-galactosidase